MTVLVDNMAGSSSLIAEHGLAHCYGSEAQPSFKKLFLTAVLFVTQARK